MKYYDKIPKDIPLTREEELRLARSSSQEDKCRLVESCLGLAYRIAHSYRQNLHDDTGVMTAANEALRRAANRFRPTKTRFRSYVARVIRGAVLTHFKRLPRHESLDAEDEASREQREPTVAPEIESRERQAIVRDFYARTKHLLTELEQKAIEAYLIEGITLTQLAENRKVTRNATSWLFRSAIRKLALAASFDNIMKELRP